MRYLLGIFYKTRCLKIKKTNLIDLNVWVKKILTTMLALFAESTHA